MLDLDPRWVIKLIKRDQMKMAEFYKQHVIDQALTLFRAHDNIHCLFTTPKLLEALCQKVSLKRLGVKGVFCGGTEMTPQFHRFAVEELLDGAYFAPTYGNTLMGLAIHKPRVPEDNYAVIYYPPSPRAMKTGSSSPTPRIALTGELTPPGIRLVALRQRAERVLKATPRGPSPSTSRSRRRPRA